MSGPVEKVLVSGLLRGDDDQSPGMTFSSLTPPRSTKSRIQQELEEQQKREQELQELRSGGTASTAPARETPALRAPQVKQQRAAAAVEQTQRAPAAAEPEFPPPPPELLTNSPRSRPAHTQPQQSYTQPQQSYTQPQQSYTQPQQSYKEIKEQSIDEAMSNVQIDASARETLQDINAMMKEYFQQGRMPPTVKAKLAKHKTDASDTTISNLEELKDFFPMIDPERLQELCQKLPDVKFMLQPENIPREVVGVKKTKKPPVVTGVQLTGVTVSTPQTKPVKVQCYSEPERKEVMKPSQETPIDREIRLAREREEDMRRERGERVPVSPSGNVRVVVETRAADSPTKSSSSQVSTQLGKKLMQKEIESHDQRERDLQNTGQIKTTSKMTRDTVYLETHGQ